MNTAKIKKILLFVIVPCILFAVMNVLWWEGAKASDCASVAAPSHWCLNIHVPNNHQYGVKFNYAGSSSECREKFIYDDDGGHFRAKQYFYHNNLIHKSNDSNISIFSLEDTRITSFLLDKTRVEIHAVHLSYLHNYADKLWDDTIEFSNNDVIKGIYFENGEIADSDAVLSRLYAGEKVDIYLDIVPQPGTLHVHKQTPVDDIDFTFENPSTMKIDSFAVNSNYNINRIREDTIDIKPKWEVRNLLINNENIEIVSNKNDDSYDKDIIELFGSENIFDIFIIDNDHIRPASWECGWIIEQLNSGNDVDLVVYHTF